MINSNSLEALLKNLIFKIDWLDRIRSKPEKYDSSKLNVLHIDIDYLKIKNSICNFDFESTLGKLRPLKSQLEYFLTSEIALAKIIRSIFLIKNISDFNEAQKILVTDLEYLNKFIDKLIQEVEKSIPHEYYLNKTLKLDFFQELISWRGRNREPLIIIQENLDAEKISIQFYDMYMGNNLKTKYEIRFCWDKNEVYYVLYKIAETNRLIDRKIFFENPLFVLKNDGIKYANLRKGIATFSKTNLLSKNFIDKYFQKTTERSTK